MSMSPDAKTAGGPPGLGREGLERLFPYLAERLDGIPVDARERFLVKAFLLLADVHGDVAAALWSLDEAAACGDADGRGTRP